MIYFDILLTHLQQDNYIHNSLINAFYTGINYRSLYYHKTTHFLHFISGQQKLAHKTYNYLALFLMTAND